MIRMAVHKDAPKAPADGPVTEPTTPAPHKAGEPVEHEFHEFKVPKATERAEAAAQKRKEEVLEIQKDVMDLNRTNVPGEGVFTVFASGDGKSDPESMTISQDGNAIVVSTTARELVFNGNDALVLVRAVMNVGPSL